jgi:DNA polymerase-4
MRVLCALMPNFFIGCETIRNPEVPRRSTIVTVTAGSQKLVLDYSPEFDDLRPDMSLQQALSRHGQAKLIHADVSYYRAVYNSLLDKLETVSPVVEGPEPGIAYIGVNGLQLIYLDDDALINAIRGVIPAGFDPLFGIAGNKFLAYLAARRCPPGEWRVVSGDVTDFLRELPCDVLPVSARSKEKLREFGLKTLGQVAALPSGPVLSQFGAEGRRLWNLARGIDETPVYPRWLKEIIEENTILPSVTVSLEAILAAVDAMIGKVFKKTAPSGLGIRSLTLWTRSWNAEVWERIIQFKEPAMELKTAMRRIRRVLEDYPQPGPTEQVGVKIDRLGYPHGRQNSLFPDLRARDHLISDIRQLELRMGTPQVYTLKEVEPWSRIPERRYALTPTGR